MNMYVVIITYLFRQKQICLECERVRLRSFGVGPFVFVE